MKYVVVGLLLIVGLATLALSFKLHAELRELARSPTPQLNSQLVRHLIPTYPPGASPKPTEVAAAISRRIYGIGAVGVLFTIGAFVMVIFIRDKSPKPTEE